MELTKIVTAQVTTIMQNISEADLADIIADDRERKAEIENAIKERLCADNVQIVTNQNFITAEDGEAPKKEVAVTLNHNLDAQRKREIVAELKQIGEQLEALSVELGANIDMSAHCDREDRDPFYCLSLLNGSKYAQAYSFSETWSIDKLLNYWEVAKDEDSN